MQIVRVQPEQPRGTIVVAVGLFDGAHDEILLGLLDRFMKAPNCGSAIRHRRPGLGHRVRQVVGEDHGIEAENDCMLDGIFELADVARPVVRGKTAEGIRRQPRDLTFRLVCVSPDEPVREHGNVVPSLA